MIKAVGGRIRAAVWETECMKLEKIKLREALRPALLCLLPLLLVLLCRALSRGGMEDALGWLVRSPGAFLFDCAIFAAALAAVYGATGRAWAAWLVGVVPLTANLISHYKLMINGSPLMPVDLALAGQLGEIAGFAVPQLHISFWVVASPLIWVGVLAVLIWKRAFFAAKPVARRVCGATGACALLLLFALPFGEAFYEPMTTAPSEQETLLRLYALYREDMLPTQEEDRAVLDRISLETDTLERQETEEPKTETEVNTQADALVAEESAPEEKEPDRATVIFLMSESFFDLTRLPGVSFEEDPLPHFHELQKTCPHGKFQTITYAGGTGYVEMEVLTGLCSAFLRGADDLTSLPDEIYYSLPCLTDVFDAEGYREYFVHSYSDELYNRRWIYHALGFEETYFDVDFPSDVEMKGGHISDMALSEKLISLYEAREDDAPLMFYAISMENHQPYTSGRFGKDNDIVLESELLNKKERECLRTYAYGARDADAALKRLTDYFGGVDEKVMIVFWGDHLPNLIASGKTVYEALGCVDTSDTGEWSTEELSEMLSTEYVIWTNYDLDAPELERAESSTMLGFHTLKYLRLPLSRYYRWLERRIDPFFLVYRSRLFGASDGSFCTDIPDEYREALEEYRAVVRDFVYSGGSVFSHCREEAGKQ